MKQKIVLFAFLGLIAALISGYASGYAQNGNDGTGATGSSGCSCHSSASTTTTVVELDSAGVPVTSYRGGQSYNVKISATNTSTSSLPKFGFQLATVKLTGAGTGNCVQAGTWGSSLPTNVQNTTTGASGLPIPIIEQSSQITATTGTGGNGTTYVESIPWTAPVAGTGSIKIYGVLNAVNNNGGSSGDKYKVATAVTITEAVAVAPIASVSIAITSGTNPTCSGSSVTFTATPTNGGSAPTYQWKVGTTVVGTGSTYTTTTLANGNAVTCVMTSNLAGVTGSPATSPAITMTINPSVTDSVNITSTATTICSGTSVTFTAHPFNAGTPTYQWKVGTTLVGTGATYSSSTLANGNVVTCVMTPTGTCVTPATSTSNAITMVVNPSVTDSVNITSTATSICTGTSVTFTAHPFNGGTPTYQWLVGSTAVGTGPTYTSSSLANGNVVTCVMTPTGSCVSPATSTSNAITMAVSSSLTDSVNITSTATTICSGTQVTFTAHPFNGGTPTYQWKVGTTVVGTGSTYVSSALANGNVVTCVMTPSGSCVSPATSTSNAITMNVNPSTTDSVNITSTATTICSGTSVTFTAHPFNGGTPSYQWYVGTTAVGTGSTYTSTTLANGNVVTCVMTPSGSCVLPATSTSNAITMTVNATGTDSVNITSTATTICSGTQVTFTAHPFNGGATPTYQWKNGTTVVGTGSTYTSSSLANGNVITCVMTPSGSCATPATSTSNAITMTVNGAAVTDSVNISASATNICSGTPVTFTAHPYNGGGSPTYQWLVGTAVVGTGSTYTSSSLANGNVVTCIMTPSGSCVSPATSTSNAITMTVGSGTPPTIQISGATSVCSGSSNTYTAQITNGGNSPSFAWTLNGSPVGSNSNTLTVPINGTSAIVCTLTSSASCASPATVPSNTVNVTVSSSVSPTITIMTSPTTICQGTLATFSATVSGQGTSPSYQWYVNANQSGTATTFSSSSLFNGDVISCKLTSSSSCASPAQVTSNTIPMTINPIPAATIVPSGTVSVCSGDSVLLTAGGGTGYQWSNAATSGTIWASQGGSYDVTVTDANGCTAAPAVGATLTVNTATPPTIHQSGGVLISSPAVSYLWQLNGTALGGADTTQSIAVTQNGNYVVSIVDANGCHASSSAYSYTNIGVSAIGADLGVRLYPVPNHGAFMIDMTEYTDAQVVIYDMYGMALYQQSLTSAHQEITDINLSSALYFVQVTTGGKVQTIKMQVIRD